MLQSVQRETVPRPSDCFSLLLSTMQVLSSQAIGDISGSKGRRPQEKVSFIYLCEYTVCKG